tara:strand:- start:247 stop:1413 length:1167 start_codon:yes stop_codon:yes gene_type:complete
MISDNNIQVAAKYELAKAIFEFKAGFHALTLLPKADKQLIFNHAGATSGAYYIRDHNKKIHFKTTNITKKVIVIYRNDNSFLPIIIDPKFEASIKIKMALGQMSASEVVLVEECLDSIHNVIQNNNIIVVQKEGEVVSFLEECDLYHEFGKYYHQFKSLKDFETKIEFLFEKMNHERDIFDLIRLRENILDQMDIATYKIFFNEFKLKYPRSKERLGYRTASVIRKALLAESKRVTFNLDKLYRSIEIVTSIKDERKSKLSYPDSAKLAKIEEDYQKAIINLNKQIEVENKIIKEHPVKDAYMDLQNIKCNWKGKDLNFDEIDSMIYNILYKKQRDSSQIGLDFENLVAESPDLQKNICLKAGVCINEESKFYFSYTHGISDIDMAVV